MLCPYCGAEIESGLSKCPLCEKDINREEEFRKLVAKGDEAMESDKASFAAGLYEKALQTGVQNEEIYVKLGNAYNRKGDRRAAKIYFKAMEYNFYNDHVHNLLINIYDRYNRLLDLRAWYEKSKETVEPEFIDKYLAIIDNMRKFKKEKTGGSDKKEAGLTGEFTRSMKSYSMMNTVFVIVGAIIVGALVGISVFKINTAFMLFFAGSFFLVSVIVIFYIRMKNMKKKKKENIMPEDILPPEILNKNK